MRQSLVILDFSLGKTRAGKSHDYRDVIVFVFKMFCVRTKTKSRCFQNPLVSFKSVFDLLRFCDVLV